jgi:hypothetical protein
MCRPSPHLYESKLVTGSTIYWGQNGEVVTAAYSRNAKLREARPQKHEGVCIFGAVPRHYVALPAAHHSLTEFGELIMLDGSALRGAASDAHNSPKFAWLPTTAKCQHISITLTTSATRASVTKSHVD